MADFNNNFSSEVLLTYKYEILKFLRIYFLSCDSQAGQVNQRSSIQMKTQKE